VNSTIVIDFFIAICLLVNTRWVYLLVTDTSVSFNAGLIVIMTFTTSLIVIRIITYPYNMLFGMATIGVVLCCIGAQWSGTVLRGIGMVIILASLRTGSLFGRTSVFERLLRYLTALLFLLDLLAPSISLLFFGILNFALVAVLLSIPEPEFETDNFEANELILAALARLTKEGALPRADELQLLKTVLYSQDRPGAGDPAGLELPLTYESLRSLFAQKIHEDLEEHKTNALFRLQLFLFETRHGELGLTALREVEDFSREI
jgi:hypothetical protein